METSTMRLLRTWMSRTLTVSSSTVFHAASYPVYLFVTVSNLCVLFSVDTATATVDPANGLTMTEADLGTVSIVLDSRPTDSVVFAISSSDVSEGTVSTSSMQFSVSNWDTTQIVTVTGIDDLQVDGDVVYAIETGAFVSNDANFNDEAVADVAVTNTDRKILAIIVAGLYAQLNIACMCARACVFCSQYGNGHRESYQQPYHDRSRWNSDLHFGLGLIANEPSLYPCIQQ
jgi:hypothetical protein